MQNMIILLLFLLAAYVQYRSLLKKREVRQVVVSISFMAVGVCLVLLREFHVKIPSPVSGINLLFHPVDLFMTRLLG
ncbi:hypothetical protein [Paenibacillus glycanilyticus]|uniref:Uncharacterized protein n=1 Tax=Paenibacillus glycanilyticus TaxID=126569 RepID=A0ABQ6GE88_9BACL|nr:hypothetical protein [Paenibacillus glycanilyticus]GLX67967.1 hypothetical protein MU1_23120 [Paenibacillus glycanilyticus]